MLEEGASSLPPPTVELVASSARALDLPVESVSSFPVVVAVVPAAGAAVEVSGVVAAIAAFVVPKTKMKAVGAYSHFLWK